MPPRTDTPRETPWPSVVLGYGPAALILLLAVAGWMMESGLPLGLARIWAAAILIFLGGVTRGLSFFTEGGPHPSQIAIMLMRFVLGLAGLLLPIGIAFLVLAIGYASLAVTDPAAARMGEAPRYFAQLRPPQSAIAVLGLLLCALLIGQA